MPSFAGLTADLPSLGVTAALVVVVSYLLTANHRIMSSNRRDRADYLAALAVREADHAAELAGLRTAHAAELAGLRARIASLEQRLAELETELDGERQRRRAAEDTAAHALRRHQ